MQKITHSFTSMGFSVIVFSFFTDPISLIIIAAIAFLLGGINDWLDFAIFRIFEHRNWFTHSLLSPVLIGSIIAIFLSAILSWNWPFYIFVVFSVSWIIHVLLDSLNITGVNLFLPKRFVRGRIHYKNREWNFILVGIGIVLSVIGFLISHFWF